MTTATAFWRAPEFAEFLPYIKATAAGDKRHFAHPRFELKSSTPFALMAKALAFEGPCAACGRKIHPFRMREGSRNAYLAVACEGKFNEACSRGTRASRAYDVIWQMVKDLPREGEQGGLL